MRIQLMRRSDQINKIHHTYKHIKQSSFRPVFWINLLEFKHLPEMFRKHDVKFSNRLKIEIIPNPDGLRKNSKNKEKKYDN